MLLEFKDMLYKVIWVVPARVKRDSEVIAQLFYIGMHIDRGVATKQMD